MMQFPLKAHRAFSIALASFVPSAKYLHQDTSFLWWWPCLCGNSWVHLLRSLHKDVTNFGLKYRTLFPQILCVGRQDQSVNRDSSKCLQTDFKAAVLPWSSLCTGLRNGPSFPFVLVQARPNELSSLLVHYFFKGPISKYNITLKSWGWNFKVQLWRRPI